MLLFKFSGDRMFLQNSTKTRTFLKMPIFLFKNTVKVFNGIFKRNRILIQQKLVEQKSLEMLDQITFPTQEMKTQNTYN